MEFIKMHGLGNDYVFVDMFTESLPMAPEQLAPAISDRHFGVGSDGLVLIVASDVADVRMRMFNVDGSEAEMCGNAIRCVAKYAYESGVCPRTEMRIETGAGVLMVRLVVDEPTVVAATVNMGRPRLRRREIPMLGSDTVRVVDEPLDVGGEALRVTCVSMGNPHCVIPVDDLDARDWLALGPDIEHHEAFPERTNVHFVEAVSRDAVRMATWERGCGPTLACGTGASAACVAMHLLGRTDRYVTARLPGGELTLDWRESDGCVYMTGPAEEVFRGEWPNGNGNGY